MTYFTSNLHGDYEKWMKIKKILQKQDDVLYVLGGVLSEVEDYPEEAFRVLRDIGADERVILINGQMEYLVYQYLNGYMEDVKDQDKYEEEIRSLPGGDCLIECLESEDPFDQREYYSILESAEVSKIDLIGDKLFYCTAGAPARYEKMKINKWWKDVTSSKLDFEKQYYEEIASDPLFAIWEKQYGRIALNRLFIISGSWILDDLEDNGENVLDNCFVIKNHKIFVSNDRNTRQTQVLGIDAAGIAVKTVA